MLPNLTLIDGTYRSIGNAVLFGERNACLATGAALANFAHLLFRHFGLVACRTFSCFATIFAIHIVHVVLVRSRNQMSRVATRRVVATMPYLHAVWNRAIGKFVAKSVSANASAIYGNQAITAAVMGANPRPAIIWPALVNFCPEALHKWTVFVVVAALHVVVVDKARWLAFNSPFAFVRAFGNWGRLAAATFTEFWVIMGLHRNLSFLVPKPGTLRHNVARYFRVHYSFNYSTNGVN